MKTKPKLKNKKPISKQKVLISGALGLMVAVTIANSLAVAYLYMIRSDAYAINHMAQLIIKATDSLNKPGVIEPLSGNIYLPEARLVLPPFNVTGPGDVAYHHSFLVGGIPEETNVASIVSLRMAQGPLANDYQSMEQMFSHVPKLQACSRGVRITYKADADGTPNATKKLSNGKTAYFYTESICHNPELLKYVQQIDSY